MRGYHDQIMAVYNLGQQDEGVWKICHCYLPSVNTFYKSKHIFVLLVRSYGRELTNVSKSAARTRCIHCPRPAAFVTHLRSTLQLVGRRKREGQISHGRKGLTRSTPWQEGGKEEKREQGRSDTIMTKQSGKYLCQNSLG